METSEELKKRVDADDPVALYDYACILSGQNPREAFKYMTFSAQLGYPLAIERLGDIYMDSKQYDKAVRWYKAGAKAGRMDCSVKLAVMNMTNNEQAALVELEELAEMGARSAAVALAEYHRSHGNRHEYNYWHSMLK